MSRRPFPLLVATCLAALAPSVQAASSAQAVSPVVRASVPAGESQVFTARFLTAAGTPAVGEAVQFSDDACGIFPNGQFEFNTVTDLNGTASATFTALYIGATYCWVTARAGAASIVFDVIVFPISSAYVSATLDPAEPRPGQPFKVVAAAQVGQYPLFNADLAARIVPRTTSASLSTTAGHPGTSGPASFSVTPDRTLGDYDVEVSYRDRMSRIAMRAPANPWQDLWWSGTAENGWGMSIVQHRDTLFANIYAYDTAGKPVWYVMPNGAWNAAHTAFTGSLFLPHGTPFTDRKSTRLNSSHQIISYAVFC